MNLSPTNLAKNTTDEKPFAVFLANFGWYSQSGPFASVDEALASGKAGGFDFQILDRVTGDMVAAWSCIGGTRYYRKVS